VSFEIINVILFLLVVSLLNFNWKVTRIKALKREQERILMEKRKKIELMLEKTRTVMDRINKLDEMLGENEND
jgi:hypothetical protein